MDKLIRVAHVTLSMGIGGIENLILDLTKSIDRNKFDFTVFCLDFGGDLLEQLRKIGCKFFVLNRRPYFDWKLIFQLAKIFRRQRYHIVHTHNQAAHFYGGLAAALARTPCLITTEHSRHYIDLKTRRRLEKRILSMLTDQWVTVSDELARATVELDGVSYRKVKVIFNGIDIERFHSPFSNTELGHLTALKRSIGIRKGCYVAITVGRLHPIKNHKMLLNAIASQDDLRKRIDLMLVGDGELRDELISLSRKLGLDHCVHFLGFRNDINKLLSISDVFILCSDTEGLPFSLLEAMAAKVPVIITESANCAGVVIDEVNGKVVNNSFASLAEGIMETLSEREKSLRLAENGFEFVKDKFSLEVMVNAYKELYLTLLFSKGIVDLS